MTGNYLPLILLALSAFNGAFTSIFIVALALCLAILVSFTPTINFIFNANVYFAFLAAGISIDGRERKLICSFFIENIDGKPRV